MKVPECPDVKAQHYIPKFYLKGFTDKQGVLWVYEKFKPLRESNPKKEAHRPDYYTHSEKGERDELAENVLKDMESRVAPVIRKLANPQYVLRPEDASHVIVFVAFMFARVPSWREYLDRVFADMVKQNQLKIAGDKEAFHKRLENYELAVGKPLGTDYEKLRQFVLRGEFNIVQKSNAFNLGSMFKSGLAITETLQNYGYQALYAPTGKLFMTSDSPVYTLLPDGKGEATVGVGFGIPGVEVYFPLNKRTCLRMKKGIKPLGRFIEEGYLNKINDITMMTATQSVFSAERCRRTSRIFDDRGCIARPGKESFLLLPPSSQEKIV